jgi:hypothetical protein
VQWAAQNGAHFAVVAFPGSILFEYDTLRVLNTPESPTPASSTTITIVIHNLLRTLLPAPDYRASACQAIWAFDWGSRRPARIRS